MYKYFVCPDPDNQSFTPENTRFAVNDKDLQKRVNEVAQFAVNNNILVFELKEMHKMIEKPKFAKYSVKDNGEVLPI
jgi:hypothetical protein